ncbi:MAG: glycosyl hydrolase family 39, partial [Terracidiphilus sp.]
MLQGLLRKGMLAAAGIAAPLWMQGQQAKPDLTIQWDKTEVVSKSIPTLQVVVNPPLRPGQPLGIAAYQAVKQLGADYVRYVPWLPYP